MPKKKTSTLAGNPDAIPAEQTDEDENTMDQTKTATPSTLNVLLTKKDHNHNLSVMNFPDWDSSRDVSFLDYSQAIGALDGVAQFAGGQIAGNANLIITAPSDKFMYDHGTGRMGFVKNTFVPGRDDIMLNINGVDVAITVDPADVPNEWGWKQLKLADGRLYAENWAPTVSPRSENGRFFWKNEVIAALLSGVNVSITVGDKLLDDARNVMAIVSSDDPLEANSAWRYARRESSRFTRQVANTGNQLRADKAEGKPVQITADALSVPLAQGGNISLLRYGADTDIYLVTTSGMELRVRRLTDNTDGARLSMAMTIRELGAKVQITRQ